MDTERVLSRAFLEAHPAEAGLILEGLPPEESAAKELQALLAYPPDSAGNLMDPRVLTFRPETTVKEALARLRALRRRDVHDVFLVNGDGRLAGVVAGQSGNTGAQALAVTMRGLALREIRLRHWPRVSAKEALAALINGLAVAATTSVAVYVWSRSTGLALVIGLSMVISMVAAGLSGAAIPMVLTAAGQDPAQSSSIILTTVTDVVGFFSFLGIATLLAGML